MKPMVSGQFDLDTMDLSSPQKSKLTNLPDEFSDIFSSGPEDIGRTGIVKHQIDTGNYSPIKQARRRVPMHQQGTLCKHVEDMLQHGVVQSSTSPRAAPIVLVKKMVPHASAWTTGS